MITLVEVKDRPRIKKVKIPQPTWGYSFPPKAFGDLRHEVSPLDLVRLKPLREKLTQAVDSTIKENCPRIPEETRWDTAQQITDEVLRYAPGQFNPKFANWAVDRAESYMFLALEQLKVVGSYTLERKELTPEEKTVEREIRRSLRGGPEEYSSQDKDDKPLQDERVEKPKKLSAYLIRKELLARDRVYNGWHCGFCHKRRKPRELKLVRVHKDSNTPQASDYVLMCELCRKKRAEKKQEKARPYDEGIGIVLEKAKKGLSRGVFYNRIRDEVLKRDRNECCYCGEKANGLSPIRPLCKGGELTIENYTAACQKCRCSKGNQLPLDFFIKRDEYYWQAVEGDGTTIKVGSARITMDPYYLAEAMQEMSKVVADKNESRERRNKFERILIKLSETDGDRAREAKRELMPLF